MGQKDVDSKEKDSSAFETQHQKTHNVLRGK